MNREKLEKLYSELEAKYREKQSDQSRRLIVLSVLRLAVFLGGIAVTVWGFTFMPAAGISALILSAAVFLFLVKKYSFHSGLADYYSSLVTINKNEILSLSGDCSAFPDGSEWTDPAHDFSFDIDLFGKDSLFQYLNRTVTGYGRSTLAGWLSSPFDCVKDIDRRQEAIKELAGKLAWRQNFIALGSGRKLDENEMKGLLDWLEGKSYFFSSRLSVIIGYVVPASVLISLLLLIAGVLHYSVFTSLFTLNLVITGKFLKKTNRIHAVVSRKHELLDSFTNLMKSFRDEDFSSDLLKSVRNGIAGGGGSAVERIKSLGVILRSFDSRLNMIVGFALNGLLLWDLHCIRSLEKWRRESEGLLPSLMGNIGIVDALNSLANFSFNNESYTWPKVTEGGAILKAEKLGHPLLPAGRRICNDFSIPREGSIIIITGANMAGKSTFLRCVAVNYILAMTGAPVCAESMSFTPVKLFTSMRTADSLSHNESYFYAELKRLRILREKLEKDRDVLFILDEILKGTNSADKSRGSRLFILKCIELGAAGLIATHDTSLAEIEKEFPGNILNRCFEIDIEGDVVKFDYRLRDGITTRMNASILMREMGITD